MTQIKYAIFLIVTLFLFISCDSSKFSIEGNISDANSMNVYFDRINLLNSESMVIEKGESNSNGSFKFKLAENPGEGFYRVRMGAKSAYIILDGSETNLVLNGSLGGLSKFDYTVEGSEKSNLFVSKLSAFANKEESPNSMQSYITNQAPADVGLGLAIILFGNNLSYANLHNELSQKVSVELPNNEMTPLYVDMADQMNKEVARRNALEKIKVGEMAPDIAMKDPSGRVRRLSDLKGNIVLLDFWASWCGPCRRDNPKVVRTYNKYKDRGFTVFSVSLDGLDNNARARLGSNTESLKSQVDRSKNRWLAAIEKDRLTWDNHVSDLKKWNSEGAAIYGVRSIPKTYLIDKEGKIAAIDPRYNLEDAIQKVLASES